MFSVQSCVETESARRHWSFTPSAAATIPAFSAGFNALKFSTIVHHIIGQIVSHFVSVLHVLSLCFSDYIKLHITCTLDTSSPAIHLVFSTLATSCGSQY